MSIKRVYDAVRVGIAALVLSLGAGCDLLHDNMDDCVLYLKFRYDYNISRVDLFAQQVEEVRVFLFDPDGGYVHTYMGETVITADNKFKLSFPYSMRNHTAVTWAGRVEDSYRLPTLEVGDRIDKLMLYFEPKNNMTQSELAHLWYGKPTVLSFDEEQGSAQTIDLVRNTNTVHVQLRLPDHTVVYPSDFVIKMTSNNGSYDFNNQFLTSNVFIDYLPFNIVNTARPELEVGTAQLRTLRLVEGEKLILSIVNRTTGRPMMIQGKDQINLIPYFAQDTPPDMSTQEYLDRRYVWDLKVNFNAENYVVISITINGWTVWFDQTDL